MLSAPRKAYARASIVVVTNTDPDPAEIASFKVKASVDGPTPCGDTMASFKYENSCLFAICEKRSTRAESQYFDHSDSSRLDYTPCRRHTTSFSVLSLD